MSKSLLWHTVCLPDIFTGEIENLSNLHGVSVLGGTVLLGSLVLVVLLLDLVLVLEAVEDGAYGGRLGGLLRLVLLLLGLEVDVVEDVADLGGGFGGRSLGLGGRLVGRGRRRADGAQAGARLGLWRFGLRGCRLEI